MVHDILWIFKISGKYLIVSGKDSVQTAYDKLEKTLNKTTSKSLDEKEKEANKPWVSTQSSELIKQRWSARKIYQNHRNSENYNTWRNIAELADTSLVNDKINKVEQMRIEADAASKRNDTKELFNIVTKLNKKLLKNITIICEQELLEEWTE